MSNDSQTTQVWAHRSREAVGVFTSPSALDSAVKRLLAAGFQRRSISVLGTKEEVKATIGHFYREVSEAEDDPRAPRAEFIPSADRFAAETTSLVMPLYVGGMLGAAAVVASGGALALALAGTVLGCVTGGTLGGLLAESVAGDRAHQVEKYLERGATILWVSVAGVGKEETAIAILKNTGARDVHVHEITSEWSRRRQAL